VRANDWRMMLDAVRERVGRPGLNSWKEESLAEV